MSGVPTDLLLLHLLGDEARQLPGWCQDQGKVSNVATFRIRRPENPLTHLGEWLVDRGLIDRVELFTSLDVVYRHRCRLGDALVWLETLSRPTIEREARLFNAYRRHLSAHVSRRSE